MGAVGYGAFGAAVGKYLGSFVDLVVKPASPTAFKVSTEMTIGAARAGALRGGLAGIALGAVVLGGYEILKQSAEHPDRAPDPRFLI